MSAFHFLDDFKIKEAKPEIHAARIRDRPGKSGTVGLLIIGIIFFFCN